MLTINSLPYIDGTPDSDQERIEWVKNGEKTLGSSTRYGSDGVLNRVGNQLNSNIQFLYTTAQSIASALNQNTNDISVIKTSLNISSNTNLINDVQNAKIQIASLTDENTSVKSELSDLSTSAKSLSANIGVKDLTDTSTRSVFQDLLWIKTELGNYASQDFNGQPVNDLSPSGLKGKYTSISTAVAAHDKSIADLTKNFKDSNVANMNVKIQAISDKLTLNDTNISNIQNSISQNATAINDLQLAIDFTNNKSISTRISTAETKLATIDNDLNSSIGVKATMNSINNLLSSRGGISDQVATANTNLNSISSIVGNTTSDGLRGQVSWIISKAGIVQDGSIPPENSIAGNLRSLESMHSSLSISFQDLQAQVADLQNRVSDLSKKGSS